MRRCRPLLAIVVAVARRLAAPAVTLLAATAAAQPDPAELDALRARISELGNSITTRQAEHDALAEQLRASELGIAALRGELTRLDAELANTGDALQQLDRELGAQRERLAARRADLARLARSSYMLLRVDFLQVLLSQEDPGAVARSRAYHGYVAEARAAQVQALREQLDNLARLEAETAARRARLEQLKTERGVVLARLEHEQAQRGAALGRIREDLGERGKRLERLQRDASALAELLAGLQREMAELAAEGDDALPFPELRGRLPWPAGGRVGHAFGTPRGDTALSWQGILIRAERGAPVRVVSRGRVAFADWLRGFGLLAIVDHGDGYMSLYGHNDTLARETGDWVDTGDVLGTVGDTGGMETSGLYFEIRKDGSPQNPVRWLARR